MTKKLVLIGTLTILVSLFSLPKVAYAHFLVEDPKTGVKAIFHTAPDDDPIAGRKSVVSFDFSKTGLQANNYSYSLQVRPTKGQEVAVPVEIESSVVLANYTFPSQGFYDIILTVTAREDGSVSKLQYGQRVTRGIVEEQGSTIGPVEVVAIVGVITVSIAAVVFSLINDSKKQKEEKKNEAKHT